MNERDFYRHRKLNQPMNEWLQALGEIIVQVPTKSPTPPIFSLGQRCMVEFSRGCKEEVQVQNSEMHVSMPAAEVSKICNALLILQPNRSNQNATDAAQGAELMHIDRRSSVSIGCAQYSCIYLIGWYEPYFQNPPRCAPCTGPVLHWQYCLYTGTRKIFTRSSLDLWEQDGNWPHQFENLMQLHQQRCILSFPGERAFQIKKVKISILLLFPLKTLMRAPFSCSQSLIWKSYRQYDFSNTSTSRHTSLGKHLQHWSIRHLGVTAQISWKIWLVKKWSWD